MIHYDLRCSAGHNFDGWFRSSAAFDHQAEAGLLGCPVCASADVSRAIMAPRLSKGAAAPKTEVTSRQAKPTEQPAPEATPVSMPAPLPDRMRAVLQRIRAEIEQKCDYVGPRFAETARAIHDGDVSPRSIYGEATPEQAEALADDGIEISSIPWVPRADG